MTQPQPHLKSETTHSGHRYLACEAWSHIFIGKTESMTRWVLDLRDKTLAIAEIQKPGAGWMALSRADADDLLDSLINANSVDENPDDWDLEPMADLPAATEWLAQKAQESQQAQQPRGG